MREIESGRFFAPAYEQPAVALPITTSEWTHLASARFGPARLCGLGFNAEWTGNSYQYDIFELPSNCWIALRWRNGGGDGWLIDNDLDRSGQACLLRHIASIEDEPRRWDYCHFLYKCIARTVHAAKFEEETRWKQAILDGRVKNAPGKARRGWKLWTPR